MKITKTPVSLTADDKSLIQEISETYCERLGMFKRLFESAAKLNVRITSVDIQEPNLETVFLHLTGRALRD